MKKVLAMALLCAAGLPVCAAGQADTTAPKFSISPTGRILMDAAAYTSNEKKDFPAGFAVPDVRVGVKAFLWQVEGMRGHRLCLWQDRP